MVNAFQQGQLFAQRLEQGDQQIDQNELALRDAQRTQAARDAQVDEFGTSAGDPGRRSALSREQRVQQRFEEETANRNLERQQRGTLAAALALRNSARNGGDVGAGFDRLAPILPKLGISEDEVPQLREQIVQDPAVLDDLIAGLTGQSATQPRVVGQPIQVIDPQTGQPQLLQQFADGTTRLIEGVQPAQSLAAQERLSQGRERIDIQRAPEQERIAAARARGKRAVEKEEEVISANRVTDDALDRISTLRDPNVRQAVSSLFGLPDFTSLAQGGAGVIGSLPGTASADAAQLLDSLSSDIRSIAFETLKGSGQITEAESQFAAEAIGNLTRAQSADSFFRELDRLEAVLNKARAARQLDDVRLEPAEPQVLTFNPETGILE